MDTCRCQVQEPSPTSAPCERCLVRRLLRRDVRATEELARHHAADLLAVARLVLEASPRVACAVEDLVNHFVAELLENPVSLLFAFDPGRGPFGRYLLQAAYWRMQDYIRSAAVSWPKGTLVEGLEDLDPPAAPAEWRLERLTALHEALANLDGDSRELLQAYYGLAPFAEAQTLASIAARLGISPSQVSRRLKALRQRLKGELS